MNRSRRSLLSKVFMLLSVLSLLMGASACDRIALGTSPSGTLRRVLSTVSLWMRATSGVLRAFWTMSAVFPSGPVLDLLSPTFWLLHESSIFLLVDSESLPPARPLSLSVMLLLVLVIGERVVVERVDDRLVIELPIRPLLLMVVLLREPTVGVDPGVETVEDRLLIALPMRLLLPAIVLLLAPAVGAVLDVEAVEDRLLIGLPMRPLLLTVILLRVLVVGAGLEVEAIEDRLLIALPMRALLLVIVRDVLAVGVRVDVEIDDRLLIGLPIRLLRLMVMLGRVLVTGARRAADEVRVLTEILDGRRIPEYLEDEEVP